MRHSSAACVIRALRASFERCVRHSCAAACVIRALPASFERCVRNSNTGCVLAMCGFLEHMHVLQIKKKCIVQALCMCFEQCILILKRIVACISSARSECVFAVYLVSVYMEELHLNAILECVILHRAK